MEIIPKREEYLISIFKLSETGQSVTNKNLSDRLGLTPPTVSEMIKKLKKENYLKDKKTIELTDEGNELVKRVLSKHRLWEYFLTEVLKFNWKDVHESAALFQSVTNDELFDKLNEFLGYPDRCPHGAVIYLNNEEKNNDLIKLSNAKKDKEYIVRRIKDERSLLEYIDTLGINLGDKITIEGFEPFDQSAIILKSGEKIRISPKATSEIFLKELKVK